jgi:hypothetical protein
VIRLPTLRPRWALAAASLALALPIGCGTGDEGADAPDARPARAAEPAEPPAPDEGIPLAPDRLADRLSRTHEHLHRAIDRWLAAPGAPGPTPREVTLYALHHQRIYVLLTARERLARDVRKRLRGEAGKEARDILAARRELGSLSTPVPLRHFRTGPALPARVLLGYYRKAERRFEVSWKVLAAVNFVESAFGRLRNKSTAGAQGPMQFIPSTWAAYGMGGNVEDPHDAIMGAANYLQASGAPENYRAALHSYNPSSAYVEAVLRYTRRIRTDRRAYFAFHSWQVFVNTPSGIRRITGPGLGH